MLPEVLDKSRRGFTAIEALIVLGIFAITIAVVMPFAGTFQESESLTTHIQDIEQVLRRAQHRSATGQRNTAWGVYFQVGSYTLFAGNSYAGRDTSFDEEHIVASSFIFSGNDEFVFYKVTGKAMTGGILNLYHSATGTGSIEITSQGGIFPSS